MKSSEHLTELFAALAKAQGQIEGAVKDKTNPAFRSKYADLGACWDACRKPLSDNGLAVVQMPHIGPDGWTLETMLTHSSGQWLSDEFTLIGLCVLAFLAILSRNSKASDYEEPTL